MVLPDDDCLSNLLFTGCLVRKLGEELVGVIADEGESSNFMIVQIVCAGPLRQSSYKQVRKEKEKKREGGEREREKRERKTEGLFLFLSTPVAVKHYDTIISPPP